MGVDQHLASDLERDFAARLDGLTVRQKLQGNVE